VDENFSKLSTFIGKEKEQRNKFINDIGKILPQDFIPQLREIPPSIRLDGGNKDYDLPEIEDDEIEIDYFEGSQL